MVTEELLSAMPASSEAIDISLRAPASSGSSYALLMFANIRRAGCDQRVARLGKQRRKRRVHAVHREIRALALVQDRHANLVRDLLVVQNLAVRGEDLCLVRVGFGKGADDRDKLRIRRGLPLCWD